jgi:hypothetical protein
MQDRIIVKHKGFITSDRPATQSIKDARKDINDFEIYCLREIEESYVLQDYIYEIKDKNFKADFYYEDNLEKATITIRTKSDTIMEDEDFSQTFMLILSDSYMDTLRFALWKDILNCEYDLSLVFSYFTTYDNHHADEILIDGRKLQKYVNRELGIDTNNPPTDQDIKEWISQINLNYYGISSVNPDKEFQKTKRVLEWLSNRTFGFSDDIPCTHLLCFTLNNPFEKIPFGIFCEDILRAILEISDTLTFGKMIDTYYIPTDVLKHRIVSQNERQAKILMADSKTYMDVEIEYCEDYQQDFLVFDNTKGNIPNAYNDCIMYAEFVMINKDVLIDDILTDYNTENLSKPHKMLKPNKDVESLIENLMRNSPDTQEYMEMYLQAVLCAYEFPTTNNQAYIIPSDTINI